MKRYVASASSQPISECRFLSVDPLWGKYLPLQPYQYAANNPVMMLDDGGKWIQAVGDKAQEAVRNSVPTCFRSSVTFTSEGILNVGPLIEAAAGQEFESNISKLAMLAQNTGGVEVVLNDRIEYAKVDGSQSSVSFDLIEKQSDGKKGWFGQTLPLTSDIGASGATSNSLFSATDNIRVVVRENRPKSGPTIGSTTAHELFGHAFFILLTRVGNASSAKHGDIEVEKAVTRAEKEAKE